MISFSLQLSWVKTRYDQLSTSQIDTHEQKKSSHRDGLCDVWGCWRSTPEVQGLWPSEIQTVPYYQLSSSVSRDILFAFMSGTMKITRPVTETSPLTSATSVSSQRNFRFSCWTSCQADREGSRSSHWTGWNHQPFGTGPQYSVHQSSFHPHSYKMCNESHDATTTTWSSEQNCFRCCCTEALRCGTWILHIEPATDDLDHQHRFYILVTDFSIRPDRP